MTNQNECKDKKLSPFISKKLNIRIHAPVPKQTVLVAEMPIYIFHFFIENQSSCKEHVNIRGLMGERRYKYTGVKPNVIQRHRP